jgi:hypothetical protein
MFTFVVREDAHTSPRYRGEDMVDGAGLLDAPDARPCSPSPLSLLHRGTRYLPLGRVPPFFGVIQQRASDTGSQPPPLLACPKRGQHFTRSLCPLTRARPRW